MKANNLAYRKRHPIRHLLTNAKQRAKAKGLPFGLVEADLSPLPMHCPVLGIRLIPPAMGTTKHDPASMSLDRLDNSKGYVRGNVAVISWRANNLKRDATVAELQALVEWMRGLGPPIL